MDVFTDRSAQHSLHVDHDRVEVQHDGSSTCLRLNARSWRVSAAARSPARRISLIVPRGGIVRLEAVADQFR